MQYVISNCWRVVRQERLAILNIEIMYKIGKRMGNHWTCTRGHNADADRSVIHLFLTRAYRIPFFLRRPGQTISTKPSLTEDRQLLHDRSGALFPTNLPFGRGERWCIRTTITSCDEVYAQVRGSLVDNNYLVRHIPPHINHELVVRDTLQD